MIRTYSELITIPTFEERLAYLQLGNTVSDIVFGGHRYLNQRLYRSREWKQVRRDIIVRDNGCDLAVQDIPIAGIVLIHHIEPITVDDLLNHNPCVFDKDNLVCVSFYTHQAIHYGLPGNRVETTYVERRPNDTAPWKA